MIDETVSTAENTIVLVGNPNVGKSVIFGYLTGKYVTVSNYPGTTVEISKGTSQVRDADVTVIDTPGTNSFIPQSEDEQVARDVLLNNSYHTVIQVADSKNIRRSLLVTIQLAEMGIPFILVQNMADEAKIRGVRIDIEQLSEIFGIPVMSATATQRKGLRKVKRNILSQQKSSFTFSYPGYIEDGITRIESLLPEQKISKRSIALMLIAGDTSMNDWITENIDKSQLRTINSIIDEVQSYTDEPLQNVIAGFRLGVVEQLLDEVLTVESYSKQTVSAGLGSLVMHPVWGIAGVAAVLYLAYWLVGLMGAGLLVDFFETVLFAQYINPFIIGLFDFLLRFEHQHLTETIEWSLNIPITSSHEISTGLQFQAEVITPEYIIPPEVNPGLFDTVLRYIHDFLVGPYGVFTMALTYGFAIVLPIVGTFFMLFSILEDSGYLPRLAVMLNRIFKSIGLNGKAILPMVLGLGCDTMATMTTRIMETRKERIIVTLLLALGIPCSAQLGVLLGMMSQVSLTGVLIWGAVISGVIILVGYLSSKIITGDSSSFIMEIPPIRKPQIGNIVVKTTARMEWYFKEVIPLFIIGTAILYFTDITGILNLLRDLGSPIVVTFLGLPAEATEAFLIGFLRRDYGAVYLFDAMNDGLMNPRQILVSMVTITLFVPCIANVLIIIKELGYKIAFYMVAFIFPFAFIIGGIINLLVSFFNISI